MVLKKKAVKEQVEEIETQEPEVNENSAAMDTLHPGTKPVVDPKSRHEALAGMIGAAAAMTSDELTKWYTQMLASTTGKELSKAIPDGRAAANAATIKMKEEAEKDLDELTDEEFAEAWDVSKEEASEILSQLDETPGPAPKTKMTAKDGSVMTVAQVEKMKKDFFKKGGKVTKVPMGKSGIKKEEVDAELRKATKEELAKVFGDTELSEEFKEKTATLFETAIEARLQMERTRVEEEVAQEAASQLEKAIDEIASKLDEYLDYTAEKWLEENQVAVETSLKNEITEDFMKGLKDLFVEHYIDIPEDKVDVVEQLSKTVDELETRLNEMIAENADLKQGKETATRKDITEELAQGLTLVEQEKLREFAKSVDADDIDEFKTKLTTIKESHFVKDVKKSVLNEQLEEVSEDGLTPEQPGYTSPNMKSYVDAIRRTSKR